jgi:outer membrane protein
MTNGSKFGIASIAMALAMAALAPADAAAQVRGKQAGDFNVRLRAIDVEGQNKSRPVNLATTGAYTNNDLNRASYEITGEIDLSYFVTSNVAFELIAASTRHDLSLNRSQTSQLGNVRVLPPTLTAQYHFLPDYFLSPYVGAGLNYTFFLDEQNAPSFNGLKLKDNWGWALQAGVDILSSSAWSLNFDVKQIFLKTEATVNLGATPLKVTDIKLDPLVIGIGVGYRF